MKCNRLFLSKLLIVVLLWGCLNRALPTVMAHGKEVNLTVTSLMPDPEQPFTRLYRVLVLFDDGDPVEDAVMVMNATRNEGGQSIGPIDFYPIGEPGLYAAEVTYDRFGDWVVTVMATEPGEGEASFTDAILPRQTEDDASDQTVETGIPENLAILFKFDGLDFLNIVFRFVHSLAGSAWFGLIGVILVAHWFMSPEGRFQTLQRLRGIFGLVAGISLAILLGSGIYNAIWDSPIRPPGVLNIRTMLEIPFGDVYLIAFLGKVAAYVVLAVITWRLRMVLQSLPENFSSGNDQSMATARPALFGLLTAVFLAVDIAVLIYMHYISHLSIFIPR